MRGAKRKRETRQQTFLCSPLPKRRDEKTHTRSEQFVPFFIVRTRFIRGIYTSTRLSCQSRTIGQLIYIENQAYMKGKPRFENYLQKLNHPALSNDNNGLCKTATIAADCALPRPHESCRPDYWTRKSIIASPRII